MFVDVCRCLTDFAPLHPSHWAMQCTLAAQDQREAQEKLAQKYHEMRETSETAAKESYDRGRDYQRNETERVLKDCRKREQACQELEGK
jgi:hypothetical protein